MEGRTGCFQRKENQTLAGLPVCNPGGWKTVDWHVRLSKGGLQPLCTQPKCHSQLIANK